MKGPFVLAVAPNGARRTEDDHPRLPLDPEAIAGEIAACIDIGAGMVHLHVRDTQRRHSLDAGYYRDAIAAIRERAGPDLLIQITTESVGHYRPDQQRICVRQLMPDSASLALRELAADTSEAQLTGRLLREMLEAGAIPQLILYHPDELMHYRQLQAAGLFPNVELPLLFVLGSHADESPHATLSDFLAGPVGDACWMVCAFGRNELPVAREALRRGGQVRVGFENNLYHPEGRRLKDNAESVALVAAAAAALNRHPACPDVCRTMLSPTKHVAEIAP